MYINHKSSLLKLMKLSSTFLEFKVKWFSILQNDLQYNLKWITKCHSWCCVEGMQKYAELNSPLGWRRDFGWRSLLLFFGLRTSHRSRGIDRSYLLPRGAWVAPYATRILVSSWYRCWIWSASVIGRCCWRTSDIYVEICKHF